MVCQVASVVVTPFLLRFIWDKPGLWGTSFSFLDEGLRGSACLLVAEGSYANNSTSATCAGCDGPVYPGNRRSMCVCVCVNTPMHIVVLAKCRGWCMRMIVLCLCMFARRGQGNTLGTQGALSTVRALEVQISAVQKSL